MIVFIPRCRHSLADVRYLVWVLGVVLSNVVGSFFFPAHSSWCPFSLSPRPFFISLSLFCLSLLNPATPRSLLPSLRPSSLPCYFSISSPCMALRPPPSPPCHPQLILYHIGYCLLSFMGLQWNSFYYSIHLLDLVMNFKLLRTVLRSVLHNGKQVG